MNRTPAPTFIMRSKSFLRQVVPIAVLALGGVLIRTAQVRSQSTNSNSAPAPVEFYHLVQGFLPEVIGPDGSPMMPAFSSPNPWNLDTAYLMSTNDKGQRT